MTNRERIAKIINSGRRVSVTDIAREVGCSRQTVYSNLEALGMEAPVKGNAEYLRRAHAAARR